MRITGVTMTEPMATSCKICTGPKTARQCRCNPPVRIEGGTLYMLPVATAKKPGAGRKYTVSFEARSTGGTCAGSVVICVGNKPKGGGDVTCSPKANSKCLPSAKNPNQKCDPTVCP